MKYFFLLVVPLLAGPARYTEVCISVYHAFTIRLLDLFQVCFSLIMAHLLQKKCPLGTLPGSPTFRHKCWIGFWFAPWKEWLHFLSGCNK